MSCSVTRPSAPPRRCRHTFHKQRQRRTLMSLDASPPKPEPRLQEAPRAKRARLRRRRVRENNTEPSSVYRESSGLR